ncbi:type II toxin-antitoxin system prevent-host-death family antitoxin [Rhizobium sp. KAs_5_22]|uniref:type II toxin-antitoxin system Phd/YefM family antitoxin n=1 Tax=Ciceribacter selenitireducens TaxID=448181 RepID=UPI00049007E6|nr:type II toxin-antitoxin system prevent-host-death family antitoxin [Ciceribacter selenitireducens]PPJ49165.1 type II toxin-antitoxin system prevent-host-death family antitoxin [Rhizobium sp. KAs_5_22]
MKVSVEIAEAAERLEELIDLVLREDEVVICRAGEPVADIVPIARKGHGTMDDVWALAAKGRPASNDQTSNHDDYYDENGLPK